MPHKTTQKQATRPKRNHKRQRKTKAQTQAKAQLVRLLCPCIHLLAHLYIYISIYLYIHIYIYTYCKIVYIIYIVYGGKFWKMVRNLGRKCQKFTWKILEIPTRRKLEKSSISRIFQLLLLPYSDRKNLPADRIFQRVKAAPDRR